MWGLVDPQAASAGLMDCYDRQGNRISMDEYLRLINENGVEYRIVEQWHYEDVLVSTVWLGFDHSFGGGPPMIFETMVFGMSEDSDEYMRRYSTEEEARQGHQEMLTLIQMALAELQMQVEQITEWKKEET